MALTKRGKYWHYDFIFKGKRFQGSTNQTNINKAKLAESAIRSTAALERLGIAPPKESPPFKQFMEGRFLDHVRKHNAEKPMTVRFYKAKTCRLLDFTLFQSARLAEIDETMIVDFTDWRLTQRSRTNPKKTVGIIAVNRELATLRKALGLAQEWRLIERIPKIRLLPGEPRRKFVLDGELEKEYLSATVYPLHHAAILMLDLGLRPEEALSLKKADITDAIVTVWSGKSKNAVRALRLTERAQNTIRLLEKLWPDSEWLFPGRLKGHLNRATLNRIHTELREEKGWPEKFVPYSCRHTFGTRLAESGATPYEIKEAMGHGDIKVSQRYIHPSASSVSRAMARKELLDKMMRGEAELEPETAKKSGE